MPLLDIFRPRKKYLERIILTRAAVSSENEPDQNCAACGTLLSAQNLRQHNYTCPSCGKLLRMRARQRIDMIFDPGSFKEYFSDLTGENILRFEGYSEKLENSRRGSGEKEAVICGQALLQGTPVCTFAMEPHFMMGSMGTVVGEKIARLFEAALEKRLPVIGFAASGGARMQEGLFSLMQMARTSAAVKRHSDAGLFYLSVLVDPCMGGVTASFAMQGDVIVSEPGASIGFAGKRVIQQTTDKALPDGFQTAESLLEHGFIDCILPRAEQRGTLAALLKMHGGQHETDSGI